MKHWTKKGDSIFMSNQGIFTIIPLNNKRIVFAEDYYEAELSRAEAIETLSEAIEWIKRLSDGG